MPNTAPYGRHWLMGAGLLCLLGALVCIDLCFIFLLWGKDTAYLLASLMLAAFLFVFVGFFLIRAGAKPDPPYQENSLTSSTESS